MNTYGTLTPYTITFKVTRRAQPQTWVRYAENIQNATESAKDALDSEFYGTAVLVKVEPIN